MFEYECWHDDYGDKWCRSTYIAESPAKAKQQHYRYLQDGIWEDKFFNVVKDMKCKKIGIASLNSLYGDTETFERMKLHRKIPFAYLGMKILASGKSATIVGSNGSMNLDVVFDGQWRKSNIHPLWKTIYFDKDGKIIKDYSGE